MLLFGTRRDRKGRIYLKVGSARELNASSNRGSLYADSVYVYTLNSLAGLTTRWQAPKSPGALKVSVL